eukprot:361690_1
MVWLQIVVICIMEVLVVINGLDDNVQMAQPPCSGSGCDQDSGNDDIMAMIDAITGHTKQNYSLIFGIIPLLLVCTIAASVYNCKSICETDNQRIVDEEK